MGTQHLITFILLAELKNFSRTAEQLFVAQSTVTNRIMELELEVGKKLLDRNKKNVKLTVEGELFLNYAKRITDLEQLAIQEINSLNIYPNTLCIGTTNTIYECHLSSKISTFLKCKNDTNIKVTISHSNELLQMLQDDLLDVIYTYIPITKNGFECDLFTTDELVLTVNPTINQFPNGIMKDELTQITYLFCNFALQEVGLFIRELFTPHYQFLFEIDNSTKLIKYLIDGIGYSFLPKSLISPYIKSGVLTVITLLDFETPKINCYCSHKYKKNYIVNFLSTNQ